MNKEEMKTKVENKVLETIILAEKLYGKTYDIPKIEFFNKGRTAGTASRIEWKIKVHEGFFKENEEDMLNQTIPHEIAHLIANTKGSKGHDKIWKRVMRDFGLSPDRCHNYDTTNVAPGYAYKCDCMTYNLTKIRHNKIKRGKRYFCKICRGYLTKA